MGLVNPVSGGGTPLNEFTLYGNGKQITTAGVLEVSSDKKTCILEINETKNKTLKAGWYYIRIMRVDGGNLTTSCYGGIQSRQSGTSGYSYRMLFNNFDIRNFPIPRDTTSRAEGIDTITPLFYIPEYKTFPPSGTGSKRIYPYAWFKCQINLTLPDVNFTSYTLWRL